MTIPPTDIRRHEIPGKWRIVEMTFWENDVAPTSVTGKVIQIILKFKLHITQNADILSFFSVSFEHSRTIRKLYKYFLY